jgi:hypothetical protein
LHKEKSFGIAEGHLGRAIAITEGDVVSNGLQGLHGPTVGGQGGMGVALGLEQSGGQPFVSKEGFRLTGLLGGKDRLTGEAEGMIPLAIQFIQVGQSAESLGADGKVVEITGHGEGLGKGVVGAQQQALTGILAGCLVKVAIGGAGGEEQEGLGMGWGEGGDGFDSLGIEGLGLGGFTGLNGGDGGVGEGLGDQGEITLVSGERGGLLETHEGGGKLASE